MKMLEKPKYYDYEFEDPPQETSSYQVLKELVEQLKQLDVKICMINYKVDLQKES